MDQARILELKKKAEEDKGPMTQFSEKTDAYLQEKVVNPLAERGYPNVGAGIAAVPSAVAGLFAKREQANAAPDAVMAGEVTASKARPVPLTDEGLKQIGLKMRGLKGPELNASMEKIKQTLRGQGKNEMEVQNLMYRLNRWAQGLAD